MGTCWSLYDPQAKEFVNLGKLRGYTDEGPTRIDLSSDKLAEFIARHCNYLDYGKGGYILQLYPDTVDQPDDDDDGWTELYVEVNSHE